MAHFVRLIAALCAVLGTCVVLLLPLRAYAAITPSTTYTWRVLSSGALVTTGTANPTEGWRAYILGLYGAYNGATCGAVYDSPAPATSKRANCTSTFHNQTLISSVPVDSCPANSTLSGGMCSCNSGYTQDGNSCVEPVDPAEEYCTSLNGQTAVATTPRPVGSSGLASYGTCYSNQYSLSACSGTMQPDLCAQAPDGKWHCAGKVVFSGSAPCTGTTNPTTPESVPAPFPEPPPPGMCPGEVNGVAVNVPCKQTQSNTTTTKETTEGGNTTSTTRQSETSCTGAGSCSTTVTTSTTSGGVTTTKVETTTQPKGEFCAQNPGASECGDQSSFGGACSTGFVCQGDAVQCAMAKELHAQWCRDNQATDESALYGSSKGAQGDQTGDLPGNQTIPFGPGSYDDSDAIGGGACITDLVIEHEWLSASLPLSMICGPLLWFKNALLFIGGLAWLLIVFRRR